MATNDLTFEGENPDEEIVLVIRRHPWTLMKTGLWIVGWLLVLTAVFLYFQASLPTSLAIYSILPIVLYLGIQAWFLWANSLYVVTSHRILVVDQESWFKRTVKELELETIITISHEINGAIATLMNFGNVDIVASGGSDRDLRLANVYDPYEIQQRIVATKRGVATTDARSEKAEELVEPPPPAKKPTKLKAVVDQAQSD